jgi:quercetin dioxygenase-like cupin family protein
MGYGLPGSAYTTSLSQILELPSSAIRVHSRNSRADLSPSLQLVRGKVFLVTMRIIISAVVALLAVIASATFVSAQDPAVVQSRTVKVKFENDRVRVLEAELPAGVKEQMHSHPAYVIYVVAGGRVRNYAADGTTTETELKTGDVLYREPLTHAAENIGTTTMHFILVELKTPPSR